jgi:hypothetical protein
MAKKKSNTQFKYTYRAKCVDCKRFVGSQRSKEEEAEADKAEHKSEPGFNKHRVEIITTQKNPILG